MSLRIPIGFRVHRSTHRRLQLLSHELHVPIGEVIDKAVASLPPTQGEIPIGRPPRRQWVRAHVRRTKAREEILP